MAKKNTHKDLEFHVSGINGDTIFSDFDAAVNLAVMRALTSGEDVQVDVCTWSVGAARAYAGDYGAEVYQEDPDASVHDRIVIKAESLGRVA